MNSAFETTITVVGEGSAASAQALLSRTIQQHEFVLTRAHPLSDVALGLSIEGNAIQLAGLRSAAQHVCESRGWDVCVPGSPLRVDDFRMLICDMDSTLIQAEVIDELAGVMGVKAQVAEITAAAMRGELDFQQSFRKRVSLLRGLKRTEIAAVLERIQLMPGALELFRTLKSLGYVTAVVSGGFDFMADRLKQQLPLDYAYTNSLAFADDTATGEVAGEIVDGARKAALLQQVAASNNIPLEEVIAVGDGANDLPMIRLAGMGVAFHAKPVVRAEAPYAITHTGLDTILYYLGANS
ncbi:MAG TPA: phosphoserine phosphatase SerB [Terriglobales bacterium]